MKEKSKMIDAIVEINQFTVICGHGLISSLNQKFITTRSY
jgi:hypothetical protein